MKKALAPSIVFALLVAAPLALRADTLMTGQFTLVGTVQNVGTTLQFNPAIVTGTGTQTGTFATLLTNGEAVTDGTQNIMYNPYTANSAFFVVGPLTLVTTLQTLNESSPPPGTTLNFSGVANLHATGFLDTLANITFSAPASGPGAFTALIVVPSTTPTVPEPQSLALFGSGALGLAGFVTRKLRSAKA
jgi:ethanolamine transporter EutH